MDSLRPEFDSAWNQFGTLEALRLVPDTLESEWTRGRDTYLAFLIGVDDPAVMAHLRGLVRRIETIPGVEPYPETYWHITVKGVGFEVDVPSQSEDVAHSAVQVIAEAARGIFAAQTAFETQIGLASAFPEVVFAELWQSLPVRDLNCRLLETVPGLFRYPFDGPNFLPHISIARFTSGDGLPQLKETISGSRTERPGPTFAVREVDLIRAHLSERAPSFEKIATYRLS